MAVRKVVTRSGRHVRGYFPSTKNGRMMAWESLLERDAIILFEFSSAVVSYQEQPSLERYYQGDRSYKYYPDFLLHLRNETQINIEVKPSSEMAKRDVAVRYNDIANFFEQSCRNFMVLTDKEIRQEPRLENLKLLAAHRREIPHQMSLHNLQSSLEEKKCMQIQDAARELGCITAVYRLLAAGYLQCDLETPINLKSIISWSGKERDYGSLHF
jgi:hypothetical protein